MNTNHASNNHNNPRSEGRASLRALIAGTALVACVAFTASFLAPAAGAAPVADRATDTSTGPWVGNELPGIFVEARQGRSTVSAEVLGVQRQLNVTLPRIRWTGAALNTTGVYDEPTLAAVRFFKSWANNSRALLRLTPLFGRIDGSVDSTTRAVLHLVSTYFERHPVGGSASAPQLTSGQAAALAELNKDRDRAGVARLRTTPELNAKAQAWVERLAASGKLAHDTLTNGIHSCWSSLAENVGYGASPASVERAFIIDAGFNPPVHRINIQNPAFDLVGIGVTYVNGNYWVVQNFQGSC